MQRELAVMFKEKCEELQPQADHLREVGKKLKLIKQDFSIPSVKTVKPQLATSFMAIQSAG